jgi:two-component system chemotaxis response regulator CheB
MACQFIAVGCSLGGFDALRKVLGGLGEDFPSPIAVVQHRSSEDSNVFASLLASHTQLRVIEVDDKQVIEDGMFTCARRTTTC